MYRVERVALSIRVPSAKYEVASAWDFDVRSFSEPASCRGYARTVDGTEVQ